MITYGLNTVEFVMDKVTYKYENNNFTVTLKDKTVFEMSQPEIDEIMGETCIPNATEYLMCGMGIYIHANSRIF